MFRDAAKEVRLHPGRFIATLVAIAISVAFMAAVSVFITTQGDTMGKTAALVSSKADVVVELNSPKEKTTEKAVMDALQGVAGVKVVDHAGTMATSLSTAEGDAYANVFALPSEEFRWAKLVAGAWPTKPGELVLGQDVAEKLKVMVGQQVETDFGKMTVVGLSDEPAQGSFGMVFGNAYASRHVLSIGSGEASPAGGYLISVDDGADPAAVVTAAKAAVAPLTQAPDEELYPNGPKGLAVATGEDTQQRTIEQMTGEFDVTKYLLLIFSAIAAMVGLIIIANTFTILLTQRRRQMGLLRAVGATGGQVRSRFLAEATLLGIIGSALGILAGIAIGWVGTKLMGGGYFGLSIPTGDLAVEFVIGVVLTVAAAMLPALKATRVAPLEALRPVATSEEVRRASIIRSLVCGAMFLLGVVLCWMSINAPVGGSTFTGPVAKAVGGAMLVALGVLFGAPLYIPLVLRALGKLVSPLGATARLAASNAVRNPRRASATATALMLACGLIITLQVGAATAEKTVLAEIAQKYPVDISVTATSTSSDAKGTTLKGLSKEVQQTLSTMPNVRQQVTLRGGVAIPNPKAPDEYEMVTMLLEASPEASTMAKLPAVRDDQMLTAGEPGKKVQVMAAGKPLTLTTVHSDAVTFGNGMVSPATFDKVVASPVPAAQWFQLQDKGDFIGPMKKIEAVQKLDKTLKPGGSAVESAMITSILDTLLKIIQGLLGAAILIALIGVSNTLGLSVIERSRESALLRALGMQKGSLRLMLLVEALLLALAGVVVGLAMGSFFGWLGIRSVLRQAEMSVPTQFGVNWAYTAGLIAIVMMAAALGSVLPGRRAANATPTEALAED